MDKTKISPEFLTIIENYVGLLSEQQISDPARPKVKISKTAQLRQAKEQEMEGPKKHAEKPQNKKILVKKTTVYAGMKYLVIVYYLEKKIEKILKQAQDEVFEDFELIYQVQAHNLTNQKEEAIVWEMTPEEASVLSHQKTQYEIANALARKIQVLNQKFIFLADSQQDILDVRINLKNVILFVEKAIKPIQTRFKQRQFFNNHKVYKEKLKEFRI